MAVRWPPEGGRAVRSNSLIYLVRPAGIGLRPGGLADGLDELGLFLPRVGARPRHPLLGPNPRQALLVEGACDPATCG